MHPDQLAIDVGTVRRLIDAQFPQWRGYPVHQMSTSGTVNAIFRVGDRLAARFPLRDRDGDPERVRTWLTGEANAARELAAVSSVPTPEPIAIGEPGEGYPLPWSIQTWLAGIDASGDDPGDSMAFAHDLAVFIAGLRRADTRGRTFTGRGRGGHLPHHDQWMETCFRASTDLLDVPSMRAMWAGFRALPEVDADVMCHQDLTPPNLLVREGRLVGVLDGGGFGPADPALDLVAAWHVLADEPRASLRAELGCGDVQWRRGMAWAFQQAMGLVWYYVESNPSMSRWGRRTLDRLTACVNS